ncbi:MAG: hypothetical protein F4227_00195 [Gammaproteobacteria bacterium]|nr:hypothetical protein [Gammaproteobacteria bacterium]MYF01434.1 hypothetical protein [Gammaproteobacteria bacterium]MYI77143.1 hypothetical protein [Gammaproteobacteria bacterium]
MEYSGENTSEGCTERSIGYMDVMSLQSASNGVVRASAEVLHVIHPNLRGRVSRSQRQVCLLDGDVELYAKYAILS